VNCRGLDERVNEWNNFEKALFPSFEEGALSPINKKCLATLKRAQRGGQNPVATVV
jgi:hypothetical protein